MNSVLEMLFGVDVGFETYKDGVGFGDGEMGQVDVVGAEVGDEVPEG